MKLYGAIISLSILVGSWVAAKEAERKGRDPKVVWNALLWVLPFGLIGSRLYHVLHFWSFYSQNLILIPQVWLGGLGIFGALIGGLFGLFLYSKLPTSHLLLPILLDSIAPGIALAQTLGRLGNILNRELLPFAYYELVWNFINFLLLMSLSRKRLVLSKGRALAPGDLFLVYLTVYSLGRFFLEFLRPDSWRIFGVPTAQIISLLAILISSVIVLRRRR